MILGIETLAGQVGHLLVVTLLIFRPEVGYVLLLFTIFPGAEGCFLHFA